MIRTYMVLLHEMAIILKYAIKLANMNLNQSIYSSVLTSISLTIVSP